MAVWIPYWDLRCIKCSDGQKILNGCEEDSYEPERWKIGEWTWQRCPVRLITKETVEYLKAYKFYKNGLLPITGGWMMQAQSFVEAIGIIETEVTRVEKQIEKSKVNG